MARPEDRPFSTRQCIDCAQVLPSHHFVVERATRTLKYRRCHRCRLDHWAAMRRDKYNNDPAWREKALEIGKRNRGRATEPVRETWRAMASRYKWTRRNVRDIAGASDGCVVVYAVPHDGRPDARGWWCAYRLVVRGQRPGAIPRRGIPVATIRQRIVDPHPTCPDAWRWCAHLIEVVLPRYMA